MPADIRIQTAHGGVDGIPGEIYEGNIIRLRSDDSPLVDLSGPILAPENERILTTEKWIRLWCYTPPPVAIRNIKLHRLGRELYDVVERYGERSQLEGYEVPTYTPRYATKFLPNEPILLSEDQQDYTEEGQIGPWIIVQWDIGPRAVFGPQEATYRISVDEY